MFEQEKQKDEIEIKNQLQSYNLEKVKAPKNDSFINF